MLIALTILTTTVLGIPIAVAITPPRRLATIGLAFLFGSGTIFATMLVLAIVHVPWSLVNVTAIALAVSAACFVSAWRLAPGAWGAAASVTALSSASSRRQAPGARRFLHFPDIATALTIAAATLFATIAPLWEWDFWAIWGLKARVFADAGTIDWRFLESRWNDFVHPDYPLLLPLNYAYATLANGAWSDRWLGLYSIAFGVAAILVIRELAADELRPLAASTLTFAAAAFALSGFVGLAEAPVIAFGTTGILYLRHRDYRTSAILLGLAASSKNEGLSLLVCVIVAMLLVDRRNALRMWPAIAIATPWLILRKMHALTTDITRGNIAERVAERLHHSGEIARLLYQNLPDKPIWLLIVIALAFIVISRKTAAATRQPGNPATHIALCLQLAAYVAAYFVTTRGVTWHVATSWPRLSRQLIAPVVVLVMLALARSFTRADDLGHAEARPDL